MGDARRRKVLGLPKTRAGKTKPEPSPSPALMRSPDEIEAEHRKEDLAVARIAAAIDFLYCVGEDAERQQTRKNLGI